MTVRGTCRRNRGDRRPRSPWHTQALVEAGAEESSAVGRGRSARPLAGRELLGELDTNTASSDSGAMSCSTPVGRWPTAAPSASSNSARAHRIN